jgi:Protein of unknown function (DUF2752)
VTSLTAGVGDRTRWQRVQGPAVLAAGVLGLSVLLHVRDPHRSGSWGFCPWLLLTGTYCPGCGGLRAVSDLTHGDLGGAASSNLLFVGSLPLVAAWWCRDLVDRWRGAVHPVHPHRRAVLAGLFLGVAALFAVLRNTGAGAWLAP